MNNIPYKYRGGLMLTVLVTLAIVVLIGVGIWVSVCPCERMPGTYLIGEEADEPVSNWSFANTEVKLCQLEVRGGLLPHSINLNCMATPDGALYLSCAGCDGKVWSSAIKADPEARLRMNSTVYPVTVTRVRDEDTLDAAWRARAAKLGRPTDNPRQSGWWSFQVVSR